MLLLIFTVHFHLFSPYFYKLTILSQLRTVEAFVVVFIAYVFYSFVFIDLCDLAVAFFFLFKFAPVQCSSTPRVGNFTQVSKLVGLRFEVTGQLV